ncbi:hypothetical protein C0Q70_00970 [Pomacea canaliculata]|uniref:DNA-dependent protein kinase catalytic subunit n=1 Tax=Pomacea canaliculata TaxID=400727 RepID=A0A2T7PY56_POMCA|nr:hypothetical protein C0Q70_00970 [Pomacea canaliculata]
MECLNRLTEWTKLEMVTTDALSQEGEISLASVWDDTYYMETYLPYLIRSKLKLLLHGDEKQQSLLSFIDDSMKNPQHRAHLESRYCEDLALMYVWQKNFDLARHYARLAVQSFFQDWSSTDSLMTASRTHCLQRLQPLLELQEFLDFVADKNNFTSFEPSHQLIARWEQRYPHVQLDLVDIWDDVVTNRFVVMNVYMDKIRDQMLSSNLMEEDHDSSIFEDIKLRQQLKLAHSCQEQNNFNLTLRILKETYSKCKREKSELLVVEWSHLYATTHQKKALSCSGIWSKDMLYNVLSTLDPLSKVAESKMLREKPALGMRHMILESRTFDAVVTGLMSVGNLEELGDKTCEKLQQYTKSPLNKGDLIKELIHHGYESLRKVISEVPEDSSRDAVCLQQDVQLALAKYCDKYLRLAEETTAVKCLLDAMRAGSAEALERFPRLLHIIEHYPDTTDMFLKKVSETIPSWMFILWISQMMALLDKHQAHAVRPIILRIATEYPQAIVYPFHISQESFTFGSTAEDRRNKQGIEELDALLSEERVPLVRTFISALEQFSQPVQMFQDWSRDITKILEKRPAAEIKKKYKEIYDMLLEMPHKGEQSGTQAQQTSFGAVSMGEFHRRFAEVFKNEFDNHFGVDGSKLVTMTAKEFSGILRNLQAQFEKHKADLTPPTNIGKYCSWMANFNPNHESRELEIPGQYDGLRKPMPEYHVKVAGFDERVLVMSSLRRPKRITIRGNDEKDYHYLVKGGEDLRQDQRIEQLFVLMNKVLEKDPVCKARRLVLKTYQVIPMNTRVGLIEWMSNTIPLKEFLLNAMTEKERTAYFGENGPSQLHYKWLPKLPKKTDWGLIYGQVYQNYSKTETMKEFRIKESKVPWDLSRRALQHLSTSPEAFHFLRCEMLTSHAVLCICHYLLGIGDRHLSNFMVNGRTGHMVGIDFGHAFGSATQFIPVPELMVFRLTRQIVNLGLPFKVKGLLENTMIHVLHALRQNHDLLLSTMDVFVKEVSLDWLVCALLRMLKLYADEDMRWYPKQKIETAARKLKGDNPSYITRDELRIGHLRNQALKDFEKVALGDVQDNIRARLKEKGLTEEQQVAALIDQATDPNILGRAWGGWEPWL